MSAPSTTGGGALSPRVRTVLAPLTVQPATTAILTDFDGTLSPIVANPHEARPLDGVPAVLAALARRFAEVAVISGRSVSYLEQYLASDRATGSDHRVRLVGLYGLEQSWGDGRITVERDAGLWQQVVDDAVVALRRGAPHGVLVEPKGLAVTVHWRGAPETEEWVTATVATEVERSGLRAHRGRLSLELRPPLDVDKGSVVSELARSCSAACYFGDDLGDLPAYAALTALRREGRHTVAVAVVDQESDPEVAAAADLTLSGPQEAMEALAWLAEAAATDSRPAG